MLIKIHLWAWESLEITIIWEKNGLYTDVPQLAPQNLPEAKKGMHHSKQCTLHPWAILVEFLSIANRWARNTWISHDWQCFSRNMNWGTHVVWYTLLKKKINCLKVKSRNWHCFWKSRFIRSLWYYCFFPLLFWSFVSKQLLRIEFHQVCYLKHSPLPPYPTPSFRLFVMRSCNSQKTQRKGKGNR